MGFFEDFKEVKSNMSIGITSLLSNITTREGSHKGGWARLLKCQLTNLGHDNVKILDNKDSLHDFDVIIFDLGAEYSGALNLFGGLDEKAFKRLQEIRAFNGPIFSWRNQLPNVSSLESRRNNQSTCESFKQAPAEFLGDVSRALSLCKVFQHAYRTDCLLIGDSHTPSVWTPAMMIERRDGRTLQGMIEHGTIRKLVNNFQIDMGHRIDQLQVHCSSIDIRHHVMRSDNGFKTTAEMATALIGKMQDISDSHLVFTHTMGIEDESRELPKTGFFKGTPFYGSWEDRNKCREIFNAILDEVKSLDSNTSVVTFPAYFFDEAGKLRFDVMEKPQSVHISPEHYRWDLDSNKLRWTEAHDTGMQTKFATIGMLANLEKDMYGTR